MKKYWEDYWLADYGCTPDGLDLMIIVGMIIIMLMIIKK
tara:strand:+ start:1138 stop:1254 length:117 start_codon:yes stop_codon:yes gene_type:complete